MLAAVTVILARRQFIRHSKTAYTKSNRSTEVLFAKRAVGKQGFETHCRVCCREPWTCMCVCVCSSECVCKINKLSTLSAMIVIRV